MGTLMSIWILVLHMNVVSCASDQVGDELVQNKQFQQETIEKFAILNLKLDTLQSTNIRLQSTNVQLQSTNIQLQSTNRQLQSMNIQLQSTNRQLTSKVDNLETKINSMETENQENLIQMQKQNKEIKLQMQMLIKNQNKKIENPVIFGKNEFDEKLRTKRILVSDPQYTHSLELQLQDLNAKVDNNDVKQTSNLNSLQQKHNHDLNSLQQNLQSQITEAIQHSNHGNVYIRWGRTTCPHVNGTDLVYSGYSGGSWFDHTGAASNYLCMPKDPEFLSSQLYTTNGWEGFVYGVEYEERNLNGNHFNHDAPCVVCRSERTAIMMIPARQHCDSGWTKEYAGFLVSGAYVNKAANEYVCLDATPETEERDIANNNGAGFFYVFSKCGSLPCTPYKENGPLPCVVCSK